MSNQMKIWCGFVVIATLVYKFAPVLAGHPIKQVLIAIVLNPIPWVVLLRTLLSTWVILWLLYWFVFDRNMRPPRPPDAPLIPVWFIVYTVYVALVLFIPIFGSWGEIATKLLIGFLVYILPVWFFMVHKRYEPPDDEEPEDPEN